MTFGWQGFRLDLPDDFAPVCLSGDAEAGYARLSGDRDRAFQIRWVKRRKGGSERATLLAYMSRLERDARKRKVPFSGSVDDDLRYRYKGPIVGWGAFISLGERAFLIEASGRGKDSLLPILHGARETLALSPDDAWLWSVFDLGLMLPSNARLDKSKFLAGMTEMRFQLQLSRLVRSRVTGKRWAFASRVLAKTDLAAWARSSLGWAHAEACEEDEGVRLADRHREALIRVDAQADRILAVAVDIGLLGAKLGNGLQWRPRWDWIALDAGFSEADARAARKA